MAKKPTKRHMVDIYRPGTELDQRGNRTGADDALIAEKVPCAITEKRGAEAEDGHQQYATKLIEVSLFTSTDWQLAERDYLVVRASGRRLEIIEIRDQATISREVYLTVGEIKA